MKWAFEELYRAVNQYACSKIHEDRGTAKAADRAGLDKEGGDTSEIACDYWLLVHSGNIAETNDWNISALTVMMAK